MPGLPRHLDDSSAETPTKEKSVRRGQGRRVILGAVAVILGWLIIGGLTGPLFATLSEKQSNDNAAFLPADAEATKAADLQAKFAEKTAVPAIIVYTSTSGKALTAAQLAAVATDAKSFADQPNLASPPIGPIPSKDKKAAQIIVAFDETAANKINEYVQPLRDQVNKTAKANGMEAHVTGFAGILADLTGAFAGIDGKLLGTAGIVVIIILLIVYRSPVLWLAPILGAGLSLAASVAVITFMVDQDLIKLNGQSQGILYVLVFGASTDYALLLISRFREELHRHERSFDAMKVAYRGSAPAILASGATVTVGLLCLLLSELNSNRSLGPVSAVGIVAAMAVTLTFLPAVLVLAGRRVFWPFMPKVGDGKADDHGRWGKLSEWLGRHARPAWIIATLVLLGLSLGIMQLKADGISQTETFTARTDSVVGQDVLLEHFPGGVGSPTTVFVAQSKAKQAQESIAGVDGVSEVIVYTGASNGPPDPSAAPKIVDGMVQLDATLKAAPDSKSAESTLAKIRTAVHEIDDGSLVGGITAVQVDTQAASKRDQLVIIPVVLLVILFILALLLRAIVAPVLLILTVLLSFFATLGVCAIVFNNFFQFAGADPSIVLFAFVFLVALGIDYNIFLMTRVREESLKVGTREGVTKGLAVTGGVITSAGVVLAATFAVLGILPLVFLAQIGFAVAFGVLMDTILVRSILVPGLVHDIGDKVWWPSALGKGHRPEPVDESEPVDQPVGV